MSAAPITNTGPTLQKINVIPNKKYQRGGVQSYASLLKKYNFAPTTEGPFQKIDTAKTDIKKLILKHSKHKYVPKVIPKLILRRSATGKRFPKKLKKIGEDGRPGQIKAEDQQNDALYICPVQIGNPPQTLYLHFDTGSSDLWVWSTLLQSRVKKPHGYQHHLFNPRKSLTFRKLRGYSWKIRYGDGSTASGLVGTDSLVLGGLHIRSQAVGLAERLSPQFASGAGDGLLGLAFGKISVVKPKPQNTPVENMMSQADIPKDQELFTAYLGSWRDRDEADRGESFYTFGFIDQGIIQTMCGGVQPYYVPVDTGRGLWEFKSESATINGTVIPRPANTAIADTGTSLALLDDTLVKAIYAAIPGSQFNKKNQGFVFPIGTSVSSLPKVTIAVGDKQFEIQKEDFGFAKIGGGDGMQYGGIQSRGTSKFDILGDTWLKSIYAIFDQGNKRFGACQRVERTQNIDAPVPQPQ